MLDAVITITWVVALTGLVLLAPIILNLRLLLGEKPDATMGVILVESFLSVIIWAMITLLIIVLLYLDKDIVIHPLIIECLAIGWVLVCYATIFRLTMWRWSIGYRVLGMSSYKEGKDDES